MYKLFVDGVSKESTGIFRSTDGAFIPKDDANTDYQQFKAELADGAELLDADGIVMTQEQVSEFIETLL